jgi:3-oxoacyl-[acyl-carrier protein] reductase
MFKLEGKVALVTGATGGIGKATAELLHKAGAEVILSGRREEVLTELATGLVGRVHTLPCDLADLSSVKNLLERAEALAGKVDILVCNAGVTRDNLFVRLKEDDFNSVMDVNLKATFLLNQAAVKCMMRRRYGRIINIASVVAVTGNFGQANYTASKAGMIGMSKSVAIEVATSGITVNCVAPGFINTPMTEVLKDPIKEKIIARVPAGKMGEPKDVAAAIVYLASDEAQYVTGQTLHVNGGMLMV